MTKRQRRKQNEEKSRAGDPVQSGEVRYVWSEWTLPDGTHVRGLKPHKACGDFKNTPRITEGK